MIMQVKRKQVIRKIMNGWESLASNSVFESMGYYSVSINSFASIECLVMKWIGAGMLRWNYAPKLIGFLQIN